MLPLGEGCGKEMSDERFKSGLKAFLRSFFKKEAPRSFLWVEDEGEIVGLPFNITNYAEPEDLRKWANVRMTRMVCPDFKANAFRVVAREHIDTRMDVTTIQPFPI